MKRRGRPLRFLGAALGGWMALRAGLLWPTLEVPRDPIRMVVPPAAATAMRVQAIVVARPRSRMRDGAVVPATPAAVTGWTSAQHADDHDAIALALAVASFLSFGREVPIDEAGAIPPPLRPTPADPARRLTGSFWAIARDGRASGLPGGQLGGSQAGVRVAYALGASRRLALTARLSTPLAARGSEAALGVEYRPADLPLRLIAEQRVALGGGRGGQALYAVAGTAPVAIAAGFRLEAYAQAGVVVRGQALGFADGAARLTRRISPAVDLGIGAWGGVQPGAGRVDLGPTISVSLPVGGRNLRVSLDWRQRVAGRARPDSGPAVSIGSDF